MNAEPVLEQGAKLLVEQLKAALVPRVLQGEEAVGLTYPGGERDCRVMVCPYDVEEVRPYGPPVPSPQECRGPGRIFALRFLVCANRKAPFDTMTAWEELVILEGVAWAVHTLPPLKIQGEGLHIRLETLTREEKTGLWQSLSAPLQPAVYLVMEPLAVPGVPLERKPVVRHLAVNWKRGGKTS